MPGAAPCRCPADRDVARVTRAGGAGLHAPGAELNATGIEQAAALAERLHDEPIDAVHTSMLVRSFQTGDDVATDHRLPVLADQDLNEVSLDLSDVPREEQHARYWEILETWLDGEQRDNGFGGESYHDVEARWGDCWDGFVAEHRGDRGTGVVKATLHPNGTLTCSEWNGVPVPSAS